MSKELTIVKNTDIIESEITKMNKFIEDGLPGLAALNDTQLHRMFELYLGGSSYSQISTILGIKKVIILYLSHTSNWYDTKIEYLNEIQENMKNKVIESKIKNQEFLLLVTQAYRKKIGHKLTEFLKTNDDVHMDDIDLKELGQVMKTIEMINDMDNSGKNPKGKTPAIGLNIGEGVTIEKSGDNKVSITPKESSVGDILKQYADEQRKLERKKLLSIEDKSDIVNSQGEKNE